MKKSQLAQTFILIIAMSSCFLYEELPVEYDYSYKGRFGKYRTYAFINSDDNKAEDQLIRNSIISHMDFLGYKLKYKNPDLLISYAIFQDSLNLRGYNQQDIKTWTETYFNRERSYIAKRVSMNSGTLYVQINDRKLKSSIWQGYVTKEYGIIDFSNQSNVKNAVRSVLNEYKIFADGFLEDRIENIN